MTGSRKALRPAVDEVVPVEDLPVIARSLKEPIRLRPDGYYWQSADGRQAFGPFASRELAWADMHAGDPEDLEPAESVQEAESELGITDWIDPETGEPAEGQGPHLQPE